MRTTAARAEFYVATDGNDDWSGKWKSPNPTKTDGPFATLDRARSAVRELKADSEKRDIVVLIRGGKYCLSETVLRREFHRTSRMRPKWTAALTGGPIYA